MRSFLLLLLGEGRVRRERIIAQAAWKRVARGMSLQFLGEGREIFRWKDRRSWGVNVLAEEEEVVVVQSSVVVGGREAPFSRVCQYFKLSIFLFS